MGSVMEVCSTCWLEDIEHFQDGAFYPQAAGPYFRLRVDWNPIRESVGAKVCPFSLTDEVIVEALELQGPRGWQPLGLRHERWKQEQEWDAGEHDALMPRMPGGPRFSVPKRYAKVRIQKQWYLMQSACSTTDRTMENVKADIIDSRDITQYALRFNAHLRKMLSGDDPELSAMTPDSVPLIQVCAPIGCCVLETAIPQLAGVRHGEVVTLTPYPAPEITKFVFDGTEDFTELPQAFFHYVSWLTGGQELLYDLQGAEGEDGRVILVDPCILRSPRGVKDLLSPLLVTRKTSSASQGPTYDSASGPGSFLERFEQLHRQCGPLCRSFDPDCRGRKLRKLCGVDVRCQLGQN